MTPRLGTASLAAGLLSALLASWADAQETKGRPPFQPQPPVKSPEVKDDRTIVFRLRAPSADAVRLESSDIPNLGRGAEMSRSDEGVWEATVGPVEPGAYRYNFSVDGVRTLDPANPATSESNANAWSLAVVPGSDDFDARDVPHGALAEVFYPSKTLKRTRRMHVYTPPGYESGDERYPVFYLLHGAFDSDDSWTSVGRANFILDNLIAAGKARPMIVVMPNGHTGPFSFGQPDSFNRQMEEFARDFLDDVKPYVESHYRVRKGRADRAIAGLSMGGAQTLDIAFPHLDDYAYVGVFSSGIFGIAGGPGPRPAPGPSWAERNKERLDDKSLKAGLRLVWFATGKDDFLVGTSRATVQMLKDHGFDVTYRETKGGHTWLNWRDYLAEFAP